MNGLKFTSAIGLLLASTAGFGVTPVVGWYTGLIGGGTYAPNVDFKTTDPLNKNTDTADLTYLIGWNGGAFLGYRLCNLRLELEGLVNDNRFKQIEYDRFVLTGSANNIGLNMTGYTYFVSGLVNGIYEFYQNGYDTTKFVPYLGLGLGYASVQSKLNVYQNGSLLGSATDSTGAGIGQAILGFNYFIDDNAAVGIDYRYMILTKSGSVTNYFQPQTINLSFTYAFGQ